MKYDSTHKPLLLYMPHGGEHGVIQVWHDGRVEGRKWVEFRGPPYSQWHKHPGVSPMQRVHDALEGWHSTVLHQDSVLMIGSHHPDYHAVKKMVDEA